jgi:hypothetical protein
MLILAIVKSIQKHHSLPPFQALFDSGSDTTFIHQQSLPPCANATIIAGKTGGQTLAGKLTTNRQVHLQEIILPEFSQSSRVDGIKAYVFNSTCNYDIIFKRNFLRLIDMTQDFSHSTMTAFGIFFKMKPKSFYHNPFHSIILDRYEEGENITVEIKVEPSSLLTTFRFC